MDWKARLERATRDATGISNDVTSVLANLKLAKHELDRETAERDAQAVAAIGRAVGAGYLSGSMGGPPFPGGVSLDSDRYVVLLACGHWVQTRHPGEINYDCHTHGPIRPARNAEGNAAVLMSWEVVALGATIDGPGTPPVGVCDVQIPGKGPCTLLADHVDRDEPHHHDCPERD